MKRDNTMTRRYLADAGVATGMRVLEIGCGSGEVTQILAELVGPTGSVLAVDRNEGALVLAQENLRAQGIEHVQFLAVDVASDLSSMHTVPDGSFDVLAGRRVLMYLPDPAAVVRRFVRWLRSDGIVVFEEADSTMTPGRVSPMTAHDKMAGWLNNMLVAEGANPSMGFHLPATLARAGLVFERVRAEATIQGQAAQFPYSTLLKLVQERVIAANIATRTEVEALAAELDAESIDPTRVYVSDMSFCAWARKP